MLLTSIQNSFCNYLTAFCSFLPDHIPKVRSYNRSKRDQWCEEKPSEPSAYYSQLFKKKKKALLFCITSLSLFPSVLSYWSRTVANELEAILSSPPHRPTDWPPGDLNPNNVLQASRDRQKGSISFPYGALRMASFLTAPADENKGNCILNQRPSCNPHNSCCLWCKYFREVSWPHSMAKAINNHKKYEPPSRWLIACVLHNALFAVSFKQFTISRPNCQSNQGYLKVILITVSLVTLLLSAERLKGWVSPL